LHLNKYFLSGEGSMKKLLAVLMITGAIFVTILGCDTKKDDTAKNLGTLVLLSGATATASVDCLVTSETPDGCYNSVPSGWCSTFGATHSTGWCSDNGYTNNCIGNRCEQ
jgi:hypothetical protein